MHLLGCTAGLIYLHTRMVNYSCTVYCAYMKRIPKISSIVETTLKTGKLLNHLERDPKLGVVEIGPKTEFCINLYLSLGTSNPGRWIGALQTGEFFDQAPSSF